MHFLFHDPFKSMSELKILHPLESLLWSVAIFVERAPYNCYKSVTASVLA